MAKAKPSAPKPLQGSPEDILAVYFRRNYPDIYRKVQLQVRRTPRRQTGKFKTNRESRWTLRPEHPDYTAADQIPRIEAKLFAAALEFQNAPALPADVTAAATTILGHPIQQETHRCPVSGRLMNFRELLAEASQPKHGRSSFHVGHVRPKARGGTNSPENTYWTTDLGNRIQGDKTLAETMKTIITMAEFHRARENVAWGEVVNRYVD